MSDAPDFIPFDQAEPAQAPSVASASAAPDFIPDDQFVPDEGKYETPEQMGKTAAEGVAKGVLGPLAELGETKLLHVRQRDIDARAEANPITHGVGEAAGLVGSAVTGMGQGAVMSKAGQAAAEAAGLANVAKEAPLLHKLGSEAVKQAAEMAVLQTGDEVGKKLMNDPNQSAESAMANIGLASALGAGFGAGTAGAGALFRASGAAGKLESILSGTKNHFNGTSVLPEAVSDAEAKLGVQVAPELRAAMTGDPKAQEYYHILKEGGHKGLQDASNKFNNDIAGSVSQSLGVSPEDVAVRDIAEEGNDIRNAFKSKYKEQYGPISDAFDKRNAEAAKIMIPDESRRELFGNLLESGMNNVGTDSPMYKLYNDYGQRAMAKDSLAGIDKLKTEINGEIDKAIRSADTNSLQALKDIRSHLGEFQENMIDQAALRSGAPDAEKLSASLLAERQATNQAYKEFAKTSNELADHLGVGRFHGYGDLVRKIDSLSPEQLMSKFSFKGNSDFIPFLQKNLPDVYEKVREAELKKFLKPAVLGAKGEAPINIKKLNDLVEKGMATDKNYVQAILPPEAVSRIQAASQLMEALPEHKSSGTAGWMTKMFKDVPRNVIGTIGAMTHGMEGGIMGGVLGQLSHTLSRDVPDAYRMAMLKYMGSSAPTDAGAFKSMVDYMKATYKGETLMAKATTGVFKAGRQVLSENMIPDDKDRSKIDKMVGEFQKTPGKFMQQQSDLGHYMPDHQAALTQSTATAAQYLSSIKPHPYKPGPLDKEIPPSQAEMARYNRALDIAAQPAIVLHHIKQGTLKPSDIQDLRSMYPQTFNNLTQKLSNEITNQNADGEAIPYHTRISLSMFLGQPLDASMTPSAIMAAQPMPKQPQQPQTGQSGKGTKALGNKSNAMYQTPGQASEKDRSSRD